MKQLKQISDFIFGKVFILTSFAIMVAALRWIDKNLFLNGSSEFQMFLCLVCLVLPPLLLILPKINSDNTTPWKIFNWTSAALIFSLGVFLFQDYKARPHRHKEYVGATLEMTHFKVILDTNKDTLCYTSHNILLCNKSEVKFDSLNPLKVYSAYKIDIFFNKTSGYLCVKSDLMKDYVFLSRSK